MNDFFKWWTIANTVWQIVNNFVTAGGPSVNPETVAQETAKELERKVFNGYLPASILDGSADIIAEAIDNHPQVQNHPDAKRRKRVADSPSAVSVSGESYISGKPVA